LAVFDIVKRLPGSLEEVSVAEDGDFR